MSQLTKRVSGVFTLGKFVNGYIVQSGEHLAIVDAGLGASFVDEIEVCLQALNKTFEDVTAIFITHEHTDHVGGLNVLQKRCNAKTFAHRRAAAVIQGESGPTFAPENELNIFQRFMLKNMLGRSVTPARVDEFVDDGDTISEIADAQVVALPGHSFGQIGLYLTDEKTLMGGDVMMHYPIFGLQRPIRTASPDWVAVTDSIQKVADMKIENLLLGHGAPLIGSAYVQVQGLARKIK